MTPSRPSPIAGSSLLRRSRTSERSLRPKPARTAVRPTVSVILTSAVGRPPIDGCLAALATKAGNEEIDVLVVRAGSGRQLPALRKVHSGVRIVTADPAASASELRAIGFREAPGDIVIFIEDEASIDAVMDRIRPRDTDRNVSDAFPAAVANPRP